MRYHFVSYSNANYDATAKYVLSYLKRNLTQLRNEGKEDGYKAMEEFINTYAESLCQFSWRSEGNIVERTRHF